MQWIPEFPSFCSSPRFLAALIRTKMGSYRWSSFLSNVMPGILKQLGCNFDPFGSQAWHEYILEFLPRADVKLRWKLFRLFRRTSKEQFLHEFSYDFKGSISYCDGKFEKTNYKGETKDVWVHKTKVPCIGLGGCHICQPLCRTCECRLTGNYEAKICCFCFGLRPLRGRFVCQKATIALHGVLSKNLIAIGSPYVQKDMVRLILRMVWNTRNRGFWKDVKRVWSFCYGEYKKIIFLWKIDFI